MNAPTYSPLGAYAGLPQMPAPMPHRQPASSSSFVREPSCMFKHSEVLDQRLSDYKFMTFAKDEDCLVCAVAVTVDQEDRLKILAGSKRPLYLDIGDRRKYGDSRADIDEILSVAQGTITFDMSLDKIAEFLQHCREWFRAHQVAVKLKPDYIKAGPVDKPDVNGPQPSMMASSAAQNVQDVMARVQELEEKLKVTEAKNELLAQSQREPLIPAARPPSKKIGAGLLRERLATMPPVPSTPAGAPLASDIPLSPGKLAVGRGETRANAGETPPNHRQRTEAGGSADSSSMDAVRT